MVRLLKYDALICLVLFLWGCARDEQQLETPSFGGMQLPLWSMPFGCEGGLRWDDNKLSVIDRHFLPDYHQWTLDMSNGRILDRSDQPIGPTRLPADTHAEISGGSLRPLRASPRHSKRQLKAYPRDAAGLTVISMLRNRRHGNMEYLSSSDKQFLDTVELWFHSNADILILICSS